MVGAKKMKRSSYSVDFKLKVVKYAEEINNNNEAGRHFGVDEKNVRRWRNDSTLQSMPKSKKAKRGPKSGQNPEMEATLLEWFDEQRQKGDQVSSLAIRFKAVKLAKSGDYPITSPFKASLGWCIRFQKRHGLTLRCKTKIAQKLPAELDEKICNFQKFIINKRKVIDYPLNRIGNMDETPMCFDMPSNTTLHRKGEKTVLIRTTGHEKTRFTVVLGCTADGGKLPPMVIFKRKTPPKEEFPRGIIIHQHPKGWMDEDGVLLWLNKAWGQRSGALMKQPSLLVWDQFRAHLTDRVKNHLKRNKTVQAVIPGGLTGILQPLDVCLNKPFKANMRKLWAEWMCEGKPEVTAKGNLKRAPLSTVVEWVKEAWEAIPEKMIKKSFLKCCISNKMDGSEDDVLWNDTETDTEENEDTAMETDTEEVDDDIARWDEDNIQYTEEDWNELFGDSDDESDFDGF